MVKIKKGDTVKVITGKDKDKEGKVLAVDRKRNKVLVDGVNKVTKHTKPSIANQQGGIIQKEAPIDISNVMYLRSMTREMRQKVSAMIHWSERYYWLRTAPQSFCCLLCLPTMKICRSVSAWWESAINCRWSAPETAWWSSFTKRRARAEW